METARTRTVVVTGAGSGVGRAVVDRFAAEGWQVGLVARGAEGLAESVSRTGASAARCQAFPCDVSDPDAVSAMAAAVAARFGPVDVLVNAAGTNVPRRALSVLSRDDWHAVLATNLHGAFYCVQAFLPGMRARGAGTIVNINSDVGKRARDLAGAAYVSSKFGLAGLAQQINAEESTHGIRACSIFPRDINTPLLDRRPQPPSAEARARMMQPEDIAAAVWLAATLPPRAIVEEIVMSSR
jgi:NAD(P)-dependent dehydrogenase (short-subunit alcohol dehydrogenase family)